MGLEATMIVMDNSETSRNGDYSPFPSRWDAQKDCVNRIFQFKTQANPESSVGLLSMGAAGPEVLTTLTTNHGNILDGFHRTKVRGQSHLHRAIMVASLALKHRQNKSQKQRIIVFTCSPLSDDDESQSSLVKLAKRMKKNNVSVDVIAFGELGEETVGKLKAFNDAVAGGHGSHLETIPADGRLLSDVVVSSPILAEETGGAGGPSSGGDGQGSTGGGAPSGGSGFDEFGIDPSADPELALALRMSMEEETARQERERQAEAKNNQPSLETVPEESKTGEQDALLAKDDAGAGSGSNAQGGSSNDRDRKGQGQGDKMDTD